MEKFSGIPIRKAQRILCLIMIAGGFGFLIYSLVTGEAGAIIASLMFILWGAFLYKKVFNRIDDTK